ILRAIAEGRPYSKRAGCEVEVGVKVLPHFPKDTTDRNRTSPFAFTGNKFEFRMLGSNASIAGPNIILNTIVSESLSQFSERLEKAQDIMAEVTAIIKDSVIKHGRIIFNGNNYSAEWVKEAKKRGLSNLVSTPDALPHFKDEKNIALFEKHKVFTREEVITRTEIMMDNYCKVVHIEALTLSEMLRQDILPAVSAYIGKFAKSASAARELCPDMDISVQKEQLVKLNALYAKAYKGTVKLDSAIKSTEGISNLQNKCISYGQNVITAMENVRKAADELEGVVGSSYWPIPTYGDILFSVK
ncbi:MAG: glutamine synthetase type III, partial [Clostridia bacterium]|nr:glutamine synthetase type III [Clostridia bacterium]